MGREDQGLRTGGPRYQMVPRVLIFLHNAREVLLLKGAPDKRLWANHYNGVGGHVEIGEDVLSAARRELSEETGLEVDYLTLRGLANIDAGEAETGIMLFIFTGWSERRPMIPSLEGELHWIPIAEVTDYPLVEDLAWLLPRLFAPDRPPDQMLYLHYAYDEGNRLVIRPAK